ncbi:MAG: response regulator [Nitriliruptor sp.]
MGDQGQAGGAAAPADDVTEVLVASGDAGTRAQVALTLGAERFVVAEAEDTGSAIRAVAGRRPAVLVLDAALPGAGAVALARTLRANPETEATRVLVLTNRGDSLTGSSPGVDASLAVPFTALALLRKVEGLLDDG